MAGQRTTTELLEELRELAHAVRDSRTANTAWMEETALAKRFLELDVMLQQEDAKFPDDWCCHYDDDDADDDAIEYEEPDDL